MEGFQFHSFPCLLKDVSALIMYNVNRVSASCQEIDGVIGLHNVSGRNGIGISRNHNLVTHCADMKWNGVQ